MICLFPIILDSIIFIIIQYCNLYLEINVHPNKYIFSACPSSSFFNWVSVIDEIPFLYVNQMCSQSVSFLSCLFSFQSILFIYQNPNRFNIYYILKVILC